jgi:hypothetical protein
MKKEGLDKEFSYSDNWIDIAIGRRGKKRLRCKYISIITIS